MKFRYHVFLISPADKFIKEVNDKITN